MANNRRYGTFEYGDVYLFDKDAYNHRGALDGRLVVDQDNATFYVRGKNKASRRIPHDRVNFLLANGLIDFDHEDSETYLIDYMMRLDEHQRKSKEQRLAKYNEGKEKKALDESRKIQRKTNKNSLIAKGIWFLGCVAIVGLGIFMAQPKAAPAPGDMSIAGVGSDYGIDSALLQDATYLTAIGNGPILHGLIFDNTILESGQQNTNESKIKENVMVNSSVSTSYPIHLRPLYYDRSTFYQSQVQIDDAKQGAIGIYLQNPNGYSLGVPANELVLCGGQGMSSVVISSPTPYEAIPASAAAAAIEEAQQQAASGREQSTNKDKYSAAQMPQDWNGYDYADIDNGKIAASYWYTTNSSKRSEDLHRRIVLWDVNEVIDKGKSAIGGMEAIQLNYQDIESNFYNPVIAQSPTSNGVVWWLGYTKQAPNGAVGFYIRRFEDADDLLVESYDNTLSTFDLTGTDYPISNYVLNGDRLFFEQQGYIWVMDLSKIQISVDLENNQRTVKKENPVKICHSSDIKPTITRDEEFIATVNHSAMVPVAHYQVTQVSTNVGLQIGIAFIESETGNLVFQPCLGATAAASGSVVGAGGNTNTATEVSSGNQTAVDKAEALNEAKNRARNGNQTPKPETTEEQPQEGAAPSEGEGASQEPGTKNDSGSVAVSPATAKPAVSVRAKQIADEEEALSMGRILIRPGYAAEYQIVCFCVRGEVFYWIEQSETDNSRKIMLSPVYYQNDAVQAMKDRQAENSVEVDPGLQAANENGTVGVGGDKQVDAPETVPDASDPTKRAEAAKRQQERQAQLAQQNANSNAEGETTAPVENTETVPPEGNETPVEGQPQDNQEQQPPPGEVAVEPESQPVEGGQNGQ